MLSQVGHGTYDQILVRKVKHFVHKHNRSDDVTTLADPRGEETCKIFLQQLPNKQTLAANSRASTYISPPSSEFNGTAESHAAIKKGLNL